MSLERPHRPYEDYSLSFLWDNVWRIDPISGLTAAKSPLELPSSNITLTYRFTEDPMSIYDCNMRFGPHMREMQRGIFNEIEEMLAGNIRFEEDSSSALANINFGLCSNLPASGRTTFSLDTMDITPRANVLISSNIYGSPIETVIEASKKSWFSTFTNQSDLIKNIFMHETGHALGLDHTHIEGYQANELILSGYTDRSTIMSYNRARCDDELMNFIAWAPTSPCYITKYGAVDEINLRYAYNLDAPSIRTDQTDNTFSRQKTPSSLLIGYGTSLISWPAQLGIGMALATTSLLAPVIAEKAARSGWNKTSAALKAISALSPQKPSETASWKRAIGNSVHDTMIAIPRTMFPFSALMYDITYTTGSLVGAVASGKELSGKALKDTTASLLTNVASYTASRVIDSKIPIYSLYALAKTAEDLSQPITEAPEDTRSLTRKVADACSYAGSHPLETTTSLARGAAKFAGSLGLNIVKTPFRLIGNARGVRHLVAGTAFGNWINPKRESATTATARVHPIQGTATASSSSDEESKASEVSPAARTAGHATPRIVAPDITAGATAPRFVDIVTHHSKPGLGMDIV